MPQTTAGYASLDIRQLRQAGLLQPRHAVNWPLYSEGAPARTIAAEVGKGKVLLTYRLTDGTRRRKHLAVALQWTECSYGGSRPWFLCPEDGCRRRVAVLYFTGDGFACRHCLQLGYQTAAEPRWMRNILKSRRIRERLGGNTGLLQGLPPRPKGMHWVTYERLCGELAEAEMNCFPPGAHPGPRPQGHEE